MRIWDVWTLFAIYTSLITICSCKSGFILTSPKALDAGSTEHLMLSLYDVPDNGTAVITLWSVGSNKVIAQNVVSTSNGHMRIPMEVLPTPDSEAWLEINGTFLGDNETTHRKLVAIRQKSIITFVQTDKPIYKPGQTAEAIAEVQHRVNNTLDVDLFTLGMSLGQVGYVIGTSKYVRIRVFAMDSQLKPLNNVFGDVWIEDPASLRIAHWRNVNFSVGVVQFELPLSEEPVLGVWSVKTEISGFSYSQNFTVQEYVLPKFEVIIQAPKYILRSKVARAFPIQVCARYTYGKKVDGQLKVTFPSRERPCEKDLLPDPKEEKISGCHTSHVELNRFSLHYCMHSGSSILVVAEVTENGTGVTEKGSTAIQVPRIDQKMNFLGFDKGYQFFKPGLPLYEKLRVSKPDNMPVAFEEIEICYTLKRDDFTKPKRCQSYSTDERGEVSFTIPASSPACHTIDLQAKTNRNDTNNFFSNLLSPSKTISLKAWFSSTGSHLQIQPIYDKVPCGKEQRIKIHYTTQNGSAINFYYQVMSKGHVVQQGSHFHTAVFTDDSQKNRIADDPNDDHLINVTNGKLPPYIGEFDLTFDVGASISPTARLLVFYVRPDGEVVSDSKEFVISQCLLNEANLRFRSEEKQYPSTETEILLSATPSSLCGVGFVDKSVHLMNSEKQINKEKIFTLMEGYDLSSNTEPIQKSKKCPPNGYHPVHDSEHGRAYNRRWRGHPRPSYSVRTTYEDRYVDSITAFENAGKVIISNYVIETRPPCHKKTIVREHPGGWHRRRGYKPVHGTLLGRVAFRSSSDVAAVYDEEPTPVHELNPTDENHPVGKEKEAAKSVAEIRSYFPETWLWELHTIGENGVTVFNRTLPDTVTQWVGSAICVHPTTGLGISDATRITAFQPFFISFTLPYSAIREEVVPVIITVFNYLTECLPIKLSLEPKKEYVIVRSSRIHKLCVCGGESKSRRFYLRPVTLGRVNITVYGHSPEDDAICGNETTAKLAARDAVTRQLLVEAEGFPKEEIFNNFLCPHDSNGTFSEETALQLPANVVEGSSRAYFSVAGDIVGPALNNLDSLVQLPAGCGEQNMVRFVPNIFVLDYLIQTGKVTDEIKLKALHHMEIGYQRELRYRHKDGSYSAFGETDKEGSSWLTAFVVRSFAHASRFITIDENDLTRSTEWIVQNQLDDGCFRRVGTVLHAGMKGGLNRGGESPAPVTAYVLIALLEAGITDKEIIRRAMMCLQSDTNPTSYSLALFAYAAALSKDPKAEDYLKQLKSIAVRKGKDMHWKYEGAFARSVEVETAAYAILAMIEAEGFSRNLLPTVRWITKQRNSNGGFVSTQDTVIALQALVKYASLVPRNQVNIDAVIRSHELIHNFRINESNVLLIQNVKLPVLPTTVQLEATGEGCVLAQYTLRYNVLFSTGSEAFDLNVTMQNGNKNCSKPRIGICIRCKILQKISNMVVVTVKMVSGYVPDKRSIEKLYSDTELALKRHDIGDSKIHFYFTELTNKQKCFQFLVRNEFKVEDVKPATIKLYDYYQTEWQITKNYEIQSACVSSTQSQE